MKRSIKVLILCSEMITVVTTTLAGNNSQKVVERGPSIVTEFRSTSRVLSNEVRKTI